MATSAETAERIEQLQGMILEGQPNTVCLTFARQTWGVSRSQGCRLLKKSWVQSKEDIDESGLDRQEPTYQQRLRLFCRMLDELRSQVDAGGEGLEP